MLPLVKQFVKFPFSVSLGDSRLHEMLLCIRNTPGAS